MSQIYGSYGLRPGFSKLPPSPRLPQAVWPPKTGKKRNCHVDLIWLEGAEPIPPAHWLGKIRTSSNSAFFQILKKLFLEFSELAKTFLENFFGISEFLRKLKCELKNPKCELKNPKCELKTAKLCSHFNFLKIPKILKLFWKTFLEFRNF